MASKRLRILLTNDDGPPSGTQGHSPFVYPFARALVDAGHDVRVVVPSSQKSWIGKAYHIADKCTGVFYYPPVGSEDGTGGETRDLPRERRDGEMEWVLLNGTPATCASVALHNLFAPNSFDLVISGPNLGRNSSTAFAMSSGTVGAAMAAAISGANAIALSWGLMEGWKPPPQEFVEAATNVSRDVVERLYDVGWGEGDERVDVYTVNVPLLPSIKKSPEVRWTTMAQTAYGRLFKSTPHPDSTSAAASAEVNKGGPAAVAVPQGDDVKPTSGDESSTSARDKDELRLKDEHHKEKLHFVFAPDLGALINPRPEDLVEDTDNHAIFAGAISITPIRAAFMPAKAPNVQLRL
ncbi:hypothetical protein JCM8208_005700 [Rhodotorula glutinis]